MKRSSVLSVLDELREKRKLAMPVNFKVRKVKFTPEEIECEVPKEVTIDNTWMNVKEWEALRSFKQGFFRLDSDLKKFFTDERQINNALRQAIALRDALSEKRKRKTA